MIKVNHNELLELSKRYICAKGLKDISIFVKFQLFKFSCDLENEVKVTKIYTAQEPVLVVHLCKFGENPFIG